MEVHGENADSKQSDYDIFLSFNKVDKPFVERLVSRVERDRVDGRRLRCFYSEWDIQPGENIVLKIEAALGQSRFIAPVMSPEWLKSDWTTLERVIPVYEDPAGIKGRLIPLLRRNCEIPASLKILKWIDFSSDSAFSKQAKVLVARLKNQSQRGSEGEPRTPAHALDATTATLQEESLATNMFPVVELPGLIYSARSIVPKRSEIWPIVGEGAKLPPFVFQEDERRIYSFSSLIDLPVLEQVVDRSETSRVPTHSLLANDRSRLVIELLNRSMTAHMRGLGMTYDWNTQKSFFPLEKPNETVRYITWRVGKRNWKRIVVIQSGSYFAHRHCKATFVLTGAHVYLRVLPGWHFTTDGIRTPVDQGTMTSLSSRWMNIERNHTLIDNIRFWANTLSKDADIIELDVGSTTKAVINSRPLLATIDHGVEGDYRERLWYAEPPGVDEATEGVQKVETNEPSK